MAELLCRTNGNADPTGKSRVYFSCHPDDFAAYFDRICEDIFEAADCAVYCSRETDGVLLRKEETMELERCNLLVIPVTFKLLTTSNRTMDVDLPFAVKNHIPVLPIMMEHGIESVYSRPDKFGERQYLTTLSGDLTEIPYREKLQHFLNSVLVDDETAKRIRAAFDAYIFLSYRKKDRNYANELMRLIHGNPECRDIAIWFDEFLVPGENFRKNIRKIMDRCNLVTLLVTPRLLEKVVDDNGEEHENFVLSVELPLAQEQKKNRGIDILAVEMEETDHAALQERAVPECINPREEDAFRNRLLDAVSRIAVTSNDDDPAHSFLIGLAYMDGIDVELDRDRGMTLITEAAEKGLPEAMERLANMCANGSGVPLDFSQAAQWGEKLLAHFVAECGEEDPKTLQIMGSLALLYAESSNYTKAQEMYERSHALKRKVFGEEGKETLIAKGNLASFYNLMGMHTKALEMVKDVYESHCRILDEEDPVTLITMGNLAVSYYEVGDYETALELNERAYAKLSRTLGEKSPSTIAALSGLVDIYRGCGKYDDALERMELAYELSCRSLGQEHHETSLKLKKLAVLYGDKREYDKQLELTKRAHEKLLETLGPEHTATLVAELQLASAYNDLGKNEKKAECFETARNIIEGMEARLIKVFGPNHQDAIGRLGILADAFAGLGEHEKAVELMEQEYALMCKALGELHPRSLTVLNNLALANSNAGRYEEGKVLQEKSYLLLRKKHGEEHPETLTSLGNLARAYLDLEKYREAVKYQNKAYEVCCQMLGEENPLSIKYLLDLAEMYAGVDDYRRVHKLMEKGYELRCKVLGAEHPDTKRTYEVLKKVRLLIATKGKIKRRF